MSYRNLCNNNSILLDLSSSELSIMIDLMEWGLRDIQSKRDEITYNDVCYDDISADIIAYCKEQFIRQDPLV